MIDDNRDNGTQAFTLAAVPLPDADEVAQQLEGRQWVGIGFVFEQEVDDYYGRSPPWY